MKLHHTFAIISTVFMIFTYWVHASELIIELTNGEIKTFTTKEIAKIYFINSYIRLFYKKFDCNNYEILERLPNGPIKIQFQVKPYNLKNQVWFGGFCGPDGRGGLGLFIWNKKLKLTLGNSCERFPEKYIEWELPSSLIKVNEWNNIEIIFIPGKLILLRINDYEKRATKNVPQNIELNKVYIGTDPRHPGRNYNFCGEMRYLSY